MSRHHHLRLVAEAEPEAVPELWFAPDPSASIVMDRSGGMPLAALPAREAMRILRAWWRHHRARYRAEVKAEMRRQKIRSRT